MSLSTADFPVESIRNTRDHLAEVVDRAAGEEVPTVITRRGKQVAAVVPLEVLERWTMLEEAQITKVLDERLAAASQLITLADVIRETRERDA